MTQSKETITIGISACLTGQKVRYDGSAKTSRFCTQELGKHVSYKGFCPEVAVGMSVPRPTIRQIEKDGNLIVSSADGSNDVTEAMTAYGKQVASQIGNLSGFIFCAKSPSCGMERVKIYAPNGHSKRFDGVGLFAAEIMKANPLLPCEENGRLNDDVIRENFIARVFAYNRWQRLVSEGISRKRLYEFHAQFKYTLMSHDPLAQKQLGRILADSTLAIEDQAEQYIHGFMAVMKNTATRKKHSNTLNHIQGYFSRELAPVERRAIADQIDRYRRGLVPLLVPVELLKHYLHLYPKAYLQSQFYLNPYPEDLKLRYSQ